MAYKEVVEEFFTTARKKVDNIKWIKIILLGSSGVGKTSLIRSYCEDKFSKSYQETVGADYGFKMYKVDDKEVAVTFWDFRGKDEFKNIRTNLYDATDICLLVYDVSSKASFEKLDQYVKEFKMNARKCSVLGVVGNKVDLGTVNVPEDFARKWAQRLKAKFYLTTSTNNQSSAPMFRDLITCAVTSLGRNVFTANRNSFEKSDKL